MKKTAAMCIGCVMLLTGAVQTVPASAQDVTSDTQRYYTAWKETFLRKNPYSKDEEQYYVFYGDETYEQAQENRKFW